MGIDPLLKKRAIALRLKGRSYTQIQRELNLASKGTLSAWFKDLQLPPSSLRLLEKNIARATEKGLLAFNAERSRKIASENNEAETEGFSSVHSLSGRELMIVGASLYWGEGTKSAGRNKTQRLVFTNSDPDMIRVFLRFVREVLNVPEERIGGELYVHNHAHIQTAINHWVRVTKIPKPRIWVGHAISSGSASERPANRLPHGTFAVRVPGRTLFHKVKGMIDAIARSKPEP